MGCVMLFISLMVVMLFISLMVVSCFNIINGLCHAIYIINVLLYTLYIILISLCTTLCGEFIHNIVYVSTLAERCISIALIALILSMTSPCNVQLMSPH